MPQLMRMKPSVMPTWVALCHFRAFGSFGSLGSENRIKVS